MGFVNIDLPADRPAEPPRRESASLAGAVASTAAVKWGSQAFTWAATLVVARLLSPHDYGIVALAGVCLGLITIFNDFGLGLAVVAYRDLTERQVAQLNTLAVIVGSAAVVLSCAAAVALANPLGASELPSVMAIMSAVLFVTSLRTVAVGRLQKDLRFGRLALAEAVQTVSTAGSTVVLAVAGFQYWALVLGQVFGHVIFTALVLSWVPPRFARPSVGGLRDVLVFSHHILVGRLAWYVQTRADLAVVGSLLGGAALGVYSMAESLGRLPVEKVGALLSQVSPAFLAASQNDRLGLQRLILTLTEALALSVFPISAGMLLVAPDAVALALGDRWLDVITPLRAFAVVAAFDAIGAVLTPVLVVTGGARLSMQIGLVGSVVLPTAFFLASSWGVLGVAVIYMIVSPLMRVPTYLGVAHRTGLTVTQYLKALWPAVSATCAMGLVVLAVQALAPPSWPLAVRLACEILAGAATYALLLATIHRPGVTAFYRMFRSLRGPRTGESTAAAKPPARVLFG